MATAKKKTEMIPRDSDKEAKKKALSTAIAQLERDFGAGAIMKLGENSALEVQAVSTGSISLDMALGIGGVPRGRIIEIFGPESSGKYIAMDTRLIISGEMPNCLRFFLICTDA